MKHISVVATVLLCALGLFVPATNAKDASQLRVYINPGHGAWDAESRGMNILREVNGTAKTVVNGASAKTGATPDTTAFFESNTNLWRSLAIVDKLQEYGVTFDATKNKTNSNKYLVGAARDLSNNIVMSRTKNGPYPVDMSNKVCDRNLSLVAAEVEANNFDVFISPHSNALTDGSTANYLALFFRGRTSGELVPHSIAIAQAVWPYLHSNSHNKWTARNSSNVNDGVIGDITFYQSNSSSSNGYLACLKHSVPGFLGESYFHTYQPARQRAMQPKYNRVDGYLYARGIASYFGLTGESTGDICGVVRSSSETFTNTLYTYKTGTPDAKKPINGATVTLKKDGAIVSSMVTDNYYNGVFVFSDLTPGTYTVTIVKRGYKTQTHTYNVTARQTLFPEIYLEIGSSNDYINDPLALTEKWNISVGADNLNADERGYDARLIRNFCYNEGKLYCVYNVNRDPAINRILVLNAQTGEFIKFLDNGDPNGSGVHNGTFALCDVKTIDGKIIACNLTLETETDAADQQLKFYIWDDDDSPATLFKTITGGMRGCNRLGDCMELSGSLDGDLYLTFANDNAATGKSHIVDFYRKNGSVWGCDNYEVYNPSLTGRLGCGNVPRATKHANGWWVDGFNCYPTWCTLNSSNQAVAQLCLVTNGNERGTGHREFLWRGDRYCASVIFDLPADASDTAKRNARARLSLNNAGDYQTPVYAGDYPPQGLGYTSNGNGTTDCIVNTDGSTYVELWVNSTAQGLCYYTFGKVPAYGIDPIITLDNEELTFETPVGISVHSPLNISTKFANGNEIKVRDYGPNAANFSLDKTRLQSDGILEVYFNPRVVGEHTATLEITCGTANPRYVQLIGISNEIIVHNFEIDEMAEMWTFSGNQGNMDEADWVSGYAGENITRDIQFVDGRLFAANNTIGVPGCEIFVIDPYSGASMQPVNTEGISGGRAILAGISGISNKLIASNSAEAGQTLKVYIWDQIPAESDGGDDDFTQYPPRVLLSDDSHAGITVGDQMNASGTLNDGYIWFSNGEKVLRYKLTDGVANPNPEVIVLEDGDLTVHGKADVTLMSNGSFWVTTTEDLPKLYAADGSLIGVLSVPDSDVNGIGKHRGTGISIVEFGSKTYLIGITYLSASIETARGAVAVVDITDGLASLGLSRSGSEITGSLVGTYPSNGLGSVPNDIYESSVTHELANDGTRLNLWGVVPYQGVTHLAFDGEQRIVTGVESVAVNPTDVLQISSNTITAPNGSVIEVFTVSGTKVASTNASVFNAASLPRGIYVVRATLPSRKALSRKICIL